jgi:membrane protein YdbS with pleckstrin-like domain
VVYVFMVFVAFALALAATSLSLAVLERRKAALVALVNSVLFVVLAAVTMGVGELRYRSCKNRVDDACRGGLCPHGYDGPFLPDCEARRVFE